MPAWPRPLSVQAPLIGPYDALTAVFLLSSPSREEEAGWRRAGGAAAAGGGADGGSAAGLRAEGASLPAAAAAHQGGVLSAAGGGGSGQAPAGRVPAGRPDAPQSAGPRPRQKTRPLVPAPRLAPLSLSSFTCSSFYFSLLICTVLFHGTLNLPFSLSLVCCFVVIREDFVLFTFSVIVIYSN